MEDIIKRIDRFLKRDIWQIDPSSVSFFRSLFVRVTKMLSFTVREVHENELTLRAMSLVYTTLLSMVPLLALAFSVLKAFGVVDTQLEPLLMRFLAPLGEQGHEIAQRVMEFVSNMRVGVLGVVGLVILVWTVFFLIKKIDDTLNIIWNVKHGRNLVRRFSNYISLTLIGPVFLFVAMALTASFASNTLVMKLMEIEPVGTLLTIWGQIVPYIIVSLIFTLIYIVVPNTKVNFGSALIGGTIAGVSWQAVGNLFAYSVASSAKYFAIYSSFAVLILFMMWLYISWLILLVGGQISYCHQNINLFGQKIDISNIGSSLREKLSILVMFLAGKDFYSDEANISLMEIVEKTRMPYDVVYKTVEDLVEAGLLTETADEPPRYIPARDMGTIKLSEIVRSTRDNSQSKLLSGFSGANPQVDKITSDIERSIEESLNGKTLRDIIVDRQML